MPLGPGKYDDICTDARDKAEARGALLVIFDGKHGGGFSAQVPADLLLMLPGLLRAVADQIEESGPF